jgi:hypothetical protein
LEEKRQGRQERQGRQGLGWISMTIAKLVVNDHRPGVDD